MGREYRHLTPRYLLNKLQYLADLRRYPDAPWLTRQANEMLASLILPTDVGLEFGSGRSTVWLANRARRLTSVEHDQTWHTAVSRQLVERDIRNVDYLFRAQDAEESNADLSGYVRVADAWPKESIDFALVDGIYRVDCAHAVLDLLAPGGLLILDDAQRYLPSNSFSPQSRRPQDGPASPKWSGFLEAVRGWRTIWTSSGVSDTAIWFKPAGASRR
jgi:predicted O-methyltransferase YrrM